MLEQALYDYLSTDAGIVALVNTRVYLSRLPERVTLPAVAYRRVSGPRLYTHDPFEATGAWVQARFQFDAWGRDALEAVNVGEAVRLALSGYSGEMGGDVVVGSSFVVDEVDLYEASTKFFRRVVDFAISYEEGATQDQVAPSPGVATPAAVGGSSGV